MTAESTSSDPCTFAVAIDHDDADLAYLATCACGWTARDDHEAGAWRAGYTHIGQLAAILAQPLRRSPRLDDHRPPPKKPSAALIEDAGAIHGVLLTLSAPCGGPGPAASHFMGETWTAASHHCRGVVPGRNSGEHPALELCACACHADPAVAARLQDPYDVWMTRMQARRDRWRDAQEQWRNRPWPRCAGCAADSDHRRLGTVAGTEPHDPTCQCPCTWRWQCERGQHDRCHGPAGSTDPVWGAPCGCACHTGVALPAELHPCPSAPAPTSATPTVLPQPSLF